MPKIRFKRGTHAQVEAAAAASQLAAGEPYLLIDRQQFAVGVSANDYVLTARAARTSLPPDATGVSRMVRLADGAVQVINVRENVAFRLPSVGDYDADSIVLVLTNMYAARTPTFAQASSAPVGSGVATGAAPLALTDSAQAWTVGAYAGSTLRITSGPHAGNHYLIDSNSATMLVLAALFTDNIAGLPADGIIGESYSIHETVPLTWVGRVAPDYDATENARNIVVARAAGTLGWIADGGML